MGLDHIRNLEASVNALIAASMTTGVLLLVARESARDIKESIKKRFNKWSDNVWKDSNNNREILP